MKVNEYIINYLINRELDTFFLVTGGAIVPIIDAIGNHPKAKYYCFQHEQSAAMAAESFYRTSGKMGVVLSTSGPGAQNLMNGICGCWYESIPCLFITGQVNTQESIESISSNPRQLGFQETDIVNAFKGFTKYIKKIDNKSLIDIYLQNAIQHSNQGRKGPSLLDIPVNIQNQNIGEEIKPNVPFPNILPLTQDNHILELNKEFKKSKRPLLLIGHGVRLSGGIDEIKSLINNIKIPFVVSWGGFDIIPHNHPLFIGDIGVYGSRGGNYAIQNCDLLISIGSRLDTRQTGGDINSFSRESFKAVVEVDFNELNKENGLKIDLPILSDAKDFINKWKQSNIEGGIITDWLIQCNKYKNTIENRKLKDDVLTSYEFLEELNLKLPKNSTIVPDEGGHLVWSMQSLKVKEGQRIYSNFGNSSMGWALPASIGAQIDNDNLVVCIDGDGGFQMNIQELQTVKHYNLPIKIFIMNNNCYGIIKQFQDAYFDSRYTATETQDYSAPDFCKVAEAYGIESVEANKSNYKEIINFALNKKGSILVNVIIDKEQKLIPKLEFGNPLEDMSPYLKDEELNNNMIIKQLTRRDNTQGWVDLKK